MLDIGAPMGTLRGSRSAAKSIHVASAEASERPYRFISAHPGNSFLNESSKGTATASPLTIQIFSEPGETGEGRNADKELRTASNNDGTNVILDTWASCRTSIILKGSFAIGSGTMTSGTPARSGPRISATESTKLMPVF